MNLPLYNHLLDYIDCPGWIESFYAGSGGVHYCVTGVRPNRVFQVAEIADDVDVGAKFPRLAALGWLSCTYQAGEVGTEMSCVDGSCFASLNSVIAGAVSTVVCPA